MSGMNRRNSPEENASDERHGADQAHEGSSRMRFGGFAIAEPQGEEELWVDEEDAGLPSAALSEDEEEQQVEAESGLPTRTEFMDPNNVSGLLPLSNRSPESHSSQDETCCICLESMQDTSKTVLIVVCGHVYHRQCLEDWLADHNTCPMCRQALFIEDDTDEDELEQDLEEDDDDDELW